MNIEEQAMSENKCNICNKTFSDKRKLHNHRWEYHDAPVVLSVDGVVAIPRDTAGYLPCPVADCDKHYKGQKRFREHVASAHGDIFKANIEEPEGTSKSDSSHPIEMAASGMYLCFSSSGASNVDSLAPGEHGPVETSSVLNETNGDPVRNSQLSVVADSNVADVDDCNGWLDRVFVESGPAGSPVEAPTSTSTFEDEQGTKDLARDANLSTHPTCSPQLLQPSKRRPSPPVDNVSDRLV